MKISVQKIHENPFDEDCIISLVLHVSPFHTFFFVHIISVDLLAF